MAIEIYYRMPGPIVALENARVQKYGSIEVGKSSNMWYPVELRDREIFNFSGKYLDSNDPALSFITGVQFRTYSSVDQIDLLIGYTTEKRSSSTTISNVSLENVAAYLNLVGIPAYVRGTEPPPEEEPIEEPVQPPIEEPLPEPEEPPIERPPFQAIDPILFVDPIPPIIDLLISNFNNIEVHGNMFTSRVNLPAVLVRQAGGENYFRIQLLVRAQNDIEAMELLINVMNYLENNAQYMQGLRVLWCERESNPISSLDEDTQLPEAWCYMRLEAVETNSMSIGE